MRKVPVLLVSVVIGVIAFVAASRQHTAAEKYEAAREKRCAISSPSDPKQQDACEHERDSGESYLPWWHVLLAWPEGITVWVIVGTGFLIAWQSYETQKSARAAARGIEIQERAQRAWLVMRSAMKDYEPSATDRQLRFWWAIGNRGKMTAQIIEMQCSYELVDSVSLDPPAKLSPLYPAPIEMKGFLIAPGETQEYYAMLWQNGLVVVPPLDVEALNRIREGTMHLRACGYVKYIDGLGVKRESRFIEHYVVPGADDRRGSGFRPLISAPADYTECT